MGDPPAREPRGIANPGPPLPRSWNAPPLPTPDYYPPQHAAYQHHPMYPEGYYPPNTYSPYLGEASYVTPNSPIRHLSGGGPHALQHPSASHFPPYTSSRHGYDGSWTREDASASGSPPVGWFPQSGTEPSTSSPAPFSPYYPFPPPSPSSIPSPSFPGPPPFVPPFPSYSTSSASPPTVPEPHRSQSSPRDSVASTTTSLSLEMSTQRAAAERTRAMSSIDSGIVLPTPIVKSRKKPLKTTGTRRVKEYYPVCIECSTNLARVERRTMEGEEDVPHPLYMCLACSGPGKMATELAEVVDAVETSDGTASYADTLSAAVDKLEGVSLKNSSPSRRPVSVIKAGKKRRASERETLQCNVCSRDLATMAFAGQQPLEEPGPTSKSSIEVICTSCDNLYKRCSDCGGGGGVRPGVGKWRCRELFDGDRKTCSLTHRRLAPVDQMTYNIWPVTAIHPQQLGELKALCRNLYLSVVLSSLAMPEILESPVPLARNFAEAQKLAVDSWTMWEPYFTEEHEGNPNNRRYLALRWSVPTVRKRGKASEPSLPLPPDDPSVLIKPDQELSGWIVGEMELNLGSLFIPVIIPLGTGETYECTTVLFQKLHARISDDLRQDNLFQAQHGLQLFPELTRSWTMLLQLKEVRILRRRGYIDLEKFLQRNPSVSPADFPPSRPVFLPPELLKGWSVFARQVTPNDSWGSIKQAV